MLRQQFKEKQQQGEATARRSSSSSIALVLCTLYAYGKWSVAEDVIKIIDVSSRIIYVFSYAYALS